MNLNKKASEEKAFTWQYPCYLTKGSQVKETAFG